MHELFLFRYKKGKVIHASIIYQAELRKVLGILPDEQKRQVKGTNEIS